MLYMYFYRIYNEDPILSACLFISAYKLMVGRT